MLADTKAASSLWRYVTSDEVAAESGHFHSDLIPLCDEWVGLYYVRGGGGFPRLRRTPPIEPGDPK